jgi:hypothetical protein
MEWSKTAEMLHRLGDDFSHVDGLLRYRDWHVITRDAPIDGGISFGEGAREAITVDWNSSPTLQTLYRHVADATTESWWRHDMPRRILQKTSEAVHASMRPMNRDDERDLAKSVGPDEQVSLEEFLRSGVGACRHHGLAAAAILEQFKARKQLRGDVHFYRNSTLRYGHGWCAYTPADGELPGKKTWVLDPINSFVGREDSQLAHWDYTRPRERAA